MNGGGGTTIPMVTLLERLRIDVTANVEQFSRPKVISYGIVKLLGRLRG